MNDILLVRKFTRQLKLDSDFCDLPYDLKIATDINYSQILTIQATRAPIVVWRRMCWEARTLRAMSL